MLVIMGFCGFLMLVVFFVGELVELGFVYDFC